MPSSYTISLRLTLQATGENNNTWGAILNAGVFGLVDYAIAGRLAFTLSGTKNLTTALGADDEARAAMLDVTGGSGGLILLPPVSKGYFVRNNASGQLTISNGGAINAVFETGDMLPVFTDGAGAVFGIILGNKQLRQFITDGDQAVIDYINIAISNGSVELPPATGQLGKVLAVQNLGAPPVEAWAPTLLTVAYISDYAADQAAKAAAIAAQIAVVNTNLAAVKALAIAMAVAL